MRQLAAFFAVALFASSSLAQIQKEDLLDVFKTWRANDTIKFVKHFDDHAERYAPEELEEEHSRRKRSAERMVGDALPVAKMCEMPGYTGQFCEFPICVEPNPFVDPRQYDMDGSYPIDVSSMGACDKVHTTIIDDSLSYIEINLQADRNVNPRLTITDPQGVVYMPDRLSFSERHHDAIFNKLHPGLYLTRSSADALNANCAVVITARTKVTLSSVFTRGNERDRYDFGTPNAIVHSFNALALHANNNPSPSSLKSVTIYAPNSVVLRPQHVSTRFGCNYEFFIDSFFCSDTGSYTMVVEGVDFHGYVFRRAAAFKCLVDPSPPSTTPAVSTPKPTPPTECHNGGVLITVPGGDNYCVCQDMWSGPTCNHALCANGGTTFQSGEGCLCPNGFTGLHCEDVVCPDHAGHGFSVDRPRLILVVRMRQAMNDVINQVRQAVLDIIDRVQFDPEYLSRYALVVFNNNEIILTDEYSSVEQLDKILQWVGNATTNAGNCTDAVFGATATALTDLLITNKSPLYIITDALPNDYNSDLEAVFQLDSFWRAPLNYIYVQPSASDPCSPDEDSPAFQALDDITARTSGIAVYVKNSSNVRDVLYNHLRYTAYRSQLLLSGDRLFCGSDNNLKKTISVDRRVDNLVIVGKGRQFFMILHGPDGNIAIPIKVYSDGDDLTIWELRNPAVGNYEFSAATNPIQSSCQFRVYQSSSLSFSLRPPGDLFWAFTTELAIDGTFMQPVANVESSPVFHLNEYPVTRPDRVFAALNIYTYREDREIEVYASNGIFRDGCSYNFYFPGFKCNRANEVLHFNFFARDEVGFYIQRAGAMYCYQFHPTPTPPDECQNGGVAGPNGTCICQPFFSGAKCQNIECLNGGKPGVDRCSCLAGFVGQFCEYPTCSRLGPRPSYGFGVDFVIAIELTQQGQQQLAGLAAVFGEVLRDVHDQHPNWIRRVVLAGFNSTWGDVMVEAGTGSYTRVLDVINQYANLSIPITDTGCVVNTWEALHAVLVLRDMPVNSIISVYQSSIPDNLENVLKAARVMEELREMRVLLNVFQTYLPKDQGFYCNANESDFQYLMVSAKRSDGHFYRFNSPNVAYASRVLPSLYSSGVVYQRRFDDCTKPQNVFFPVDGHTQTLQLIVRGFNSSATAFKADGRALDDPISIVNDPQTGWNIIEYRNPCDQEWHKVSQYCIRFDGLRQTGTGAFDSCAAKGAVVVDDLTTTKHTYLLEALNKIEVWLGLRYLNGKWVFDYGGGKTGPLGKDTFWKDNTPPANPDATPCAYMNTDGFWVASECSAQKSVVCQKFAYDLDHVPGRIGDDDLSPGKYYATVQTVPHEITNSCYVEVRAQSAVVVETGFNENIHEDFPETTANKASRANYLITSVAIEGNKDTSYMTHALLYSFGQTSAQLLEAAVYMPRIGCNYDFITQPISCDQTGGDDFSILNIGVDDTGNTFQRVTTGICARHDFFCANGGMSFEGNCVCADYWTGLFCQTPICQNGGTLNNDERTCTCPQGYGGPACQFTFCTSQSGHTFTNDGKTLAFVVEKSKLNADSLKNLANNLQAIVDAAMADHSKWFEHYEVVSFDSKGIADKSYLSSNLTEIAVQIQHYADEATEDGLCDLPIYSALGHLFDNDLWLDGSEVFIVTRAIPNDEDQASLVYTQFSIHNPKVSYLLSHSPEKVCPGQIGKDIYAHVARFALSTGGAFFLTSPATIVDEMKTLLPTMYGASTMEVASQVDCNFVQYFQLDSNVTRAYVSISGTAASVSIEGPMKDGDLLTAIVNTTKQSLYSYEKNAPGTHKITVSSPPNTKCVASLYSVGGVQVVVGFTQNSEHIDDVKPYAVANAINYPVFHLIDPDASGFIRGNLFYTQAWISSSGRDPIERPDYFSEIERRGNCTYEYFSKPFGCDLDDVIYLGVSGSDTVMQTFARMAFTYCLTGNGTWGSTPLPPVTPPKPTGSTGRPIGPADISFDIYFLVDVSENDNNVFYESVAKPFMHQVMSIYTISPSHAHVGIITLPGEAGMTMVSTFLGGVSGLDAFDRAIEQGEQLATPGDMEYIVKALTRANDPKTCRKQSNGYRSSISNHLIVVLTERTDFEDQAAAVAAAVDIRKQNSYGLITIGYGNKLEPAKLEALSSKNCAYTATDPATLFGAVLKSVQAQIWNAYTSPGISYCPAA